MYAFALLWFVEAAEKTWKNGEVTEAAMAKKVGLGQHTTCRSYIYMPSTELTGPHSGPRGFVFIESWEEDAECDEESGRLQLG
jgi:hypothetical protein